MCIKREKKRCLSVHPLQKLAKRELSQAKSSTIPTPPHHLLCWWKWTSNWWASRILTIFNYGKSAGDLPVACRDRKETQGDSISSPWVTPQDRWRAWRISSQCTSAPLFPTGKRSWRYDLLGVSWFRGTKESLHRQNRSYAKNYVGDLDRRGWKSLLVWKMPANNSHLYIYYIWISENMVLAT